MGRTANYSRQTCGIAGTLEIVGDPWTILILRDAFLGVRRFEQWQERLGVARNVLAARLKTLVAHGVMETRPYSERPPRNEYVLTAKGQDLRGVLLTLAESIGVGTRGDYYDKTGALRDMIQNHALQLLTMIAMEPPSTSDADAIRDEKLKVLRSLKPFTTETVLRDVVRGQYKAGTVQGDPVKGYLEEVKVPSDSTCETFVALRTEVQNWRWAGVPFYLRTGKRLPGRDAQIVVNFRPVPHPIFPGSHRANKLVIKLQPEDGLELHLLAAKGNLSHGGAAELLSPVKLDLDFDKAFPTERVGAYERLLLDAIAGRLNLFVRSDEQEQAWRWVMPILQTWQNDPNGPRPYAAGSWGPPAASAMVARDGCAWDEEQ